MLTAKPFHGNGRGPTTVARLRRSRGVVCRPPIARTSVATNPPISAKSVYSCRLRQAADLKLRASTLSISEQFRQHSAFFHQMEGAAFAVFGAQIINPQRMEHRSSDMLGTHGIVLGVLGQFVG